MSVGNLIYVVVFPDNSEFFIDSRFTPSGVPYRRLAEKAVKDRKITNNRLNRTQLLLKVFCLIVEDGKLLRQLCGEYAIIPPDAPLTAKEFETATAELLADLPVEFHQIVLTTQYPGEADTSGYNALLENMTARCREIRIAIKVYEERIRNN